MEGVISVGLYMGLRYSCNVLWEVRWDCNILAIFMGGSGRRCKYDYAYCELLGMDQVVLVSD